MYCLLIIMIILNTPILLSKLKKLFHTFHKLSNQRLDISITLSFVINKSIPSSKIMHHGSLQNSDHKIVRCYPDTLNKMDMSYSVSDRYNNFLRPFALCLLDYPDITKS
ncbi:hypothetical protein M5W70_03385 [Paenibacillus larvae]|uniref:Uncharacterized protein n=2 Tax=Paenibacillus larvae TaxID=1464 RepID=A0AAP5N1Q7_9BACL|nr:hypothetical protein [Paenibacillus larvae]MCY9687813.1 hypothetical protein [Paenibacillus larvae]MDT2253741.1 hypothetical protein [Paenibacillus larvae]